MEKACPEFFLYSCVADDHDDKQILEALQPYIVGIRMNVIKKSAATKEHVVRKKIGEHSDINPLPDDDDDDELESINKEEECSIEMRERSQIKSFQHGDLTAIILYASLCLLVATLIAGSVWDMTKSSDQEKSVEGAVYCIIVK